MDNPIWRERFLGEIVNVKSSKRIFAKEYVDSGIPFYRSKEIVELANKGNTHSELFISNERYFEIKEKFGVPQNGDLLLTSVGTIGKTWIVDDRKFYFKDGNLTQIEKNEDVDMKFIQYYFKSPLFFSLTNGNLTGTAYNALTIKKINQLKIPFPPLPEQNRIVSKLDALFERIDQSIALLEANIKHTEALMASALDEVFTLTTRRVSISDLIEKTKNINPKQNPNQEFTYIDITSINNKTHIIEDPKFVKGEDAPSRARKGVEYGDILFATTRPNLRNIAVINKSYNNPIASTGFCVLRVKKGVNSDFVFNCLLSNEIQKQITPFIRGAQYPAISDKNLTSCKVPALEFKEQNAIAKKIKFLREKAIELQKEQQGKLNNLKALKESILDKAFKGEL